ncbi:MAG: hypothetical protein ACOY31_10825 [Bacillota bacterium]
MARFFTGILIVAVLLCMAVSGCVQIEKEKGISFLTPTTSGSGDGRRPEWSGPESLGPEKPLPGSWCVEFTYKCGVNNYYSMLVDSAGNWYDKSKGARKDACGVLEPAETESLVAALGKVNWSVLPQLSSQDYTAYHIDPKEIYMPPMFTGYSVKMWPGQIQPLPDKEAREVRVDTQAPMPGEVKEIIDEFIPLMKKYIVSRGK